MKLMLSFLFVALVAGPAVAAPAVHLQFSEWDCGPTPKGPPQPPYTGGCDFALGVPLFRLGQPIMLWVSPVDSSGFRTADYGGTIVFSSSDASAVFSTRSHTYTPSDDGAFLVTLTLHAAGPLGGPFAGTNTQTVIAADSAGVLTGLYTALIAGAPPPLPVPALGDTSLLILAVAFALAGSLALARRT